MSLRPETQRTRWIFFFLTTGAITMYTNFRMKGRTIKYKEYLFELKNNFPKVDFSIVNIKWENLFGGKNGHYIRNRFHKTECEKCQ